MSALRHVCGGTTLLAFKDFYDCVKRKEAATEVYKESLFLSLSLSVNILINKLEHALKQWWELKSLCTNDVRPWLHSHPVSFISGVCVERI